MKKVPCLAPPAIRTRVRAFDAAPLQDVAATHRRLMPRRTSRPAMRRILHYASAAGRAMISPVQAHMARKTAAAPSTGARAVAAIGDAPHRFTHLRDAII